MIRLDWVLAPAAQYAATGLGIGLCVYLFVTVKAELRRQAKGHRRRVEPIQELVERLQSSIQDLNERLSEAEEQRGLLVEPQPPRSGLNFGKRSEALRLHRRGESAERI